MRGARRFWTKPTFKAALKRRRCVFLADGFYEWQRRGRDKAPFLIREADGGPMPLAGLWETYTDPTGSEIDTAAIVTTDANGTLSAVHDRMPVILARETIAAWLDVGGVDDKEAMTLVRPCPDEWLSDGAGLDPREQGRERRSRACRNLSRGRRPSRFRKPARPPSRAPATRTSRAALF